MDISKDFSIIEGGGKGEDIYIIILLFLEEKGCWIDYIVFLCFYNLVGFW